MGNYCCSDEEFITHLGQGTIELPSLSPELQQSLQQKKPFHNKIPLFLTRIRYGKQVYQGRVDLKNRPQGFGKMFKSDGSLFIGMFSRGRPTGKGYYFLKDGTYFEGDVKNNMINDKKGVICAKGIKFTGEISNNILNGEGEEEGERYRFVGIYKDNRRFKGTLEWMHRRHKIKYKGYFDQNNKFTRNGILEERDGVYEGQFRNGKKNGNGIYTYSSKLRYAGQYVDGQKQGKGTLFNANGQVSYDGHWKNGLPHGKGSFRQTDGEYIQSQFSQGLNTKFLIPKYYSSESSHVRSSENILNSHHDISGLKPVMLQKFAISEKDEQNVEELEKDKDVLEQNIELIQIKDDSKNRD